MGEMVKHISCRLDIFGDGPDRRRCEEEIERSGLGDCVVVHGRRSREECLSAMSQADLMMFPSYREPVGHVVIEALALGLPVVALNYGGPKAIVSSSAGVLVEPGDPTTLPQRIAEHVLELLGDPGRLWAMRSSARQSVSQHHLWPAKADWLVEQYLRLSRSRG
jgi:glycosyltransferase involved in cell wall biosynthesis